MHRHCHAAFTAATLDTVVTAMGYAILHGMAVTTVSKGWPMYYHTIMKLCHHKILPCYHAIMSSTNHVIMQSSPAARLYHVNNGRDGRNGIPSNTVKFQN